MDKISPKDLDRGYVDTGYIPETNKNVFKDAEAEEMKMRKKYGMCMEEESEYNSGGFLDGEIDLPVIGSVPKVGALIGAGALTVFG